MPGDASGNWSATLNDADLPDGDRTVIATISATDAAGNTETVTEQFDIDTVVDPASIYALKITGQGILELETKDATDNYTVNTLNPAGTVSSPAATKTVDPQDGTEFEFGAPIPDGTHLVLSRSDAVGNTSSTLVIFDDNATNSGTLDHAKLGDFNIDNLDLQFSTDVQLTLSEADIKALSNNSDTLTIHGSDNDNDRITLTGGNATSAGTRVVDGELYNVYTIGNDGTTLVVDQDVQVVI